MLSLLCFTCLCALGLLALSPLFSELQQQGPAGLWLGWAPSLARWGDLCARPVRALQGANVTLKGLTSMSDSNTAYETRSSGESHAPRRVSGGFLAQ